MDIKPFPGAALLPIQIVGTQPLLMSNSLAVMKQGAIGKRLGELTKLRRRTEADEAELRKIKFLMGLYYDPRRLALSCLAIIFGPRFSMERSSTKRAEISSEAALFSRRSSSWSSTDRSSVIPDELHEDGRFVDIRPARVGGKSMIEACRPIYPAWSLKATIESNDQIGNVSDIKKAVEIAGLCEGLGTWRRRFGRFEVSFGETSIVSEEKRKAGVSFHQSRTIEAGGSTRAETSEQSQAQPSAVQHSKVERSRTKRSKELTLRQSQRIDDGALMRTETSERSEVKHSQAKRSGAWQSKAQLSIATN